MPRLSEYRRHQQLPCRFYSCHEESFLFHLLTKDLFPQDSSLGAGSCCPQQRTGSRLVPLLFRKRYWTKTSCSNLSVRATWEVSSFSFTETLPSSGEHMFGSVHHLPASVKLVVNCLSYSVPQEPSAHAGGAGTDSCTELRRAGLMGHHSPHFTAPNCLCGVPPSWTSTSPKAPGRMEEQSMVILFEHCGC